MNPYELYELKCRCKWFFSDYPPKNDSPARVLAALAKEAEDYPMPDNYGQGALIEDFETQLATLLGKEAAVFLPSGTMGQQSALRIWANRRETKTVAFHPKSHLETSEGKAYTALHGLCSLLVGDPHRLLTLAELQQVPERLGAILLELPQRELGSLLPSWEELSEISAWARSQGIPLHMDGARLWESQPFYRRGYAEITSLFDSVYVSFYKGLGGIAGAAVAGPSEFIAELRLWQLRHGGRLKRLYPYVLAARKGLRDLLGRMDAYHQRAVEIAAILSPIEGIQVTPNPPHTNMMFVHLRGDIPRLEQASLEIARKHQTYLFYKLFPSPFPGYGMFEPSVKEATMGLEVEVWGKLFEELLMIADRENENREKRIKSR